MTNTVHSHSDDGAGAYAGLRLVKKREQAQAPKSGSAPAAAPKPKVSTPARLAEPILSPAAAAAEVRAAIAESQGLPTPGPAAVATKPGAPTDLEKRESAARIWEQAMSGKPEPLPASSPAAQAAWDQAIANIHKSKGQ